MEPLSPLTQQQDIDSMLWVGREFSSYKDFQAVLDARLSLLNEKWRKDKGCTTVGNYNKNCLSPELHLPDHLKYYIVEMRCIHEGEWRPSKNQCKRFKK